MDDQFEEVSAPPAQLAGRPLFEPLRAWLCGMHQNTLPDAQALSALAKAAGIRPVSGGGVAIRFRAPRRRCAGLRTSRIRVRSRRDAPGQLARSLQRAVVAGISAHQGGAQRAPHSRSGYRACRDRPRARRRARCCDPVRRMWGGGAVSRCRAAGRCWPNINGRRFSGSAVRSCRRRCVLSSSATGSMTSCAGPSSGCAARRL